MASTTASRHHSLSHDVRSAAVETAIQIVVVLVMIAVATWYVRSQMGR